MNKSVLSISLDLNIVSQTYADAHIRHLEYAKEFRNFSVIILNIYNKRYGNEYHFENLHTHLTNTLWKFWAVPKAILIALMLNKKYKFDVITTQDPLATGLVGLILKLILGTPLNIQFHESYDLINKSLVSKFIKFVLFHAKSTRVVNLNLYKQIKKLFPKLNVMHIPMMIDTVYFYKQIKPKNDIQNFISVGRIIPSKNFTLLVEAFSQLVKNYPKAMLYIAGNGISSKSVQDMIKQKKSENKIKQLGMLNRKKLKEYYHKMDVFVLASDHEGWGGVFIEAAAAGLPIVSTNVGAIKAIFKHGETARIVPVGDTEKLAGEIEWVINHPKETYQMAIKAQKMVMQMYDKQKLKNEWVELLKETK